MKTIEELVDEFNRAVLANERSDPICNGEYDKLIAARTALLSRISELEKHADRLAFLEHHYGFDDQASES